MLLPTTWRRYGYTIEDVHNTYEKMDASYVWQIALMLLCGVYEPEAASAGVRPTFQSLFTFLFISRKTVFDVFIESQSESISKRVGTVLCHERPDHKPLLPKVSVARETFDACKRAVPFHHPSFRRITQYESLVPFKDIHLVPVEYDAEHQLVYMARVVDKRVYDAIPVKPKECVVTMPVYVQCSGSLYVMLEEACFFAVPDDSVFVNSSSSAAPTKRKVQKKTAIPVKKRKT